MQFISPNATVATTGYIKAYKRHGVEVLRSKKSHCSKRYSIPTKLIFYICNFCEVKNYSETHGLLVDTVSMGKYLPQIYSNVWPQFLKIHKPKIAFLEASMQG